MYVYRVREDREKTEKKREKKKERKKEREEKKKEEKEENEVGHPSRNTPVHRRTLKRVADGKEEEKAERKRERRLREGKSIRLSFSSSEELSVLVCGGSMRVWRVCRGKLSLSLRLPRSFAERSSFAEGFAT